MAFDDFSEEETIEHVVAVPGDNTMPWGALGVAIKRFRGRLARAQAAESWPPKR